MNPPAWLENLGIEPVNPGVFCGEWRGSGPVRERRTPIDGTVIAQVREASPEDYEIVISRAHEAFLKWRTTPAPRNAAGRGAPARGLAGQAELGSKRTFAPIAVNG